MMLFKVISHTDTSSFSHSVISLTATGPLGAEIAAQGVPVRALGISRGIPGPSHLLRLAQWIRQERPDVIQTWMYHANLLGGLAAKFVSNAPVAWSIHHGIFDPDYDRRSTLWIARGSRLFSTWLTELIMFCSETSYAHHARLGYRARRTVVIPNGFDLDSFKPDADSRRSVRSELGLGDSTILIGMIARFNPTKDHQNFIQAAAMLHSHHPEIHFLLCGENVSWDTPELAEPLKRWRLSHRVHLLGQRKDVARLTASIDIATLSSCCEAFPNTIGEAMCCGIPCVVTDVGDSRSIVGDTGIVVPSRDPEALARGWRAMIDMGSDNRAAMGRKARKRIEEKFSIRLIVRQYERIYTDLAGLEPKNHESAGKASRRSDGIDMV